MGKLNLGILGGFSGTVGTVIGSTNKRGDDIIRAKSKRSRPESSANQVKQQTKFAMATKFMQPVNLVLQSGMKYVANAEKISPYNYACRYALANAVIETEGEMRIDYSKVLISVGSLSRDMGATATFGDGSVVFNWSDAIVSSTGDVTDVVCLLVYNVSKGEVSFSNGQFLREAKTATIQFPYNTTGDMLVSYLFFRSSINPLLVSSSQFLGSALVE